MKPRAESLKGKQNQQTSAQAHQKKRERTQIKQEMKERNNQHYRNFQSVKNTTNN